MNLMLIFLNIQVFFVDYGNCSKIHRSDIYEWESSLDDIPFKAFHCRLNNIKSIREYDWEGRAFLLNLIMNKRLDAQVM